MSKAIRNGIYCIIDPAGDKAVTFAKLKAIIPYKLAALQIWDNFNSAEDNLPFIEKVVEICHDSDIPVIINNRIELLQQTNFDGIHFDSIRNDMDQLKMLVNRKLILGITCNNELNTVEWAIKHNLDYISFCSMFESTTSTSCDLVDFNTVREARKMTGIPIYLAGGITLENIDLLNELDYQGIVIVSGIFNANDASDAFKLYQHKIKIK